MFQKISLSLALFLFAGLATLQAQTPASKYGHMNLGNLLEEMPATKKANEELKGLADKLTAKGDSMGLAFQTAYNQLEKEYNDGVLTPVVFQQRQEALQKQQDELAAFQEDAQKQIDTRRDQLLEPILKEVEAAIKAVAVENGYLMIFDVSSGAMLFANETDDVTALVKKKLGL